MTVWLTGIPSAGKSTLARGVARLLREQGRRTEILDGDEIRQALSPGLAFTKEDRDQNVRRIGFVAQLLARNGVIVLAPVIAPYADSRAAVREHHQSRGTPYYEVYVSTPVEVCASRDVKGLYAAQRAGRISHLTGVDDPYEVPVDPDLEIRAHLQSVEESVGLLYAALRRQPA